MSTSYYKKRRAKTPQRALEILMWLCAKVEKSTGDARRLLYRWGVEPAEHQGIIDRLTEEKFIDDERYATAYVREKMKFSGWGARKISYMLYTKGIARETIEGVLAELMTDTEELDDRLEKYLVKKMRTVKALTPYEFRDKLVKYGLSLGYNYSDIKRVLAQIEAKKKHAD